MRENSILKIVLTSLLMTLSFAVATVFIALVASSEVSGTFGIGAVDGGRISTAAGGLSESFVASLFVALPVVSLLVFLLLRRRYR